MIGLVLSLAFVVWFFILAGRQGRNPWGWAAAGFLSYSLPVAAWALILKAVQLLDLAIRAEPRHQNAHLAKGIVLLHDLKDPSGALESFEELLEINPLAQVSDGRSLADLVDLLRENPKAATER